MAGLFNGGTTALAKWSGGKQAERKPMTPMAVGNPENRI
jgi:hypothetical protein